MPSRIVSCDYSFFLRIGTVSSTSYHNEIHYNVYLCIYCARATLHEIHSLIFLMSCARIYYHICVSLICYIF